MKRLLMIGFIGMIGNMLMAQQPFEHYGYKPKVATLSNGQYNEFFDQDSLVQIGTVIINTNTGNLVSFVHYDTVRSEATLNPELISRWLSPDPLSSKYYSLSPYNFVANNPIKYIDPDGRKIIIFGERFGFLGLRRHKYEYHGGASAPTGANQFTQDAFAALNYARGGDKRGIIDALAESEDNNINVKRTGRDNGFYNHFRSNVKWNSKLAVSMPDEDGGGSQPPALVLFHEVAHGYRHKFSPEEYYADLATEDKEYDTREERKVVEQYETPAAKAHGHGTRTSHGGDIFYVSDPTSTTPNRSALDIKPPTKTTDPQRNYIGSAGQAGRPRNKEHEKDN